MPDLEVEVMLENHPHLFVVEIESVLEAPQVGASFKCKICGFQGIISHVGAAGRKERKDHTPTDGQRSIFGKE